LNPPAVDPTKFQKRTIQKARTTAQGKACDLPPLAPANTTPEVRSKKQNSIKRLQFA